MQEAIINKIIPMSLVDGPGNRTAIFFQGCNFNCMYCHNPETINHCINCGECVEPCPTGALSFIDGKVRYNRAVCIDCDNCIKICPHGSTPKTTRYTVEELVEEVKKSIPFIDGITTSGGECTLQHKFLTPFFKEVKKLGLTVLVDTNGGIDFSQESLKEFVEVTDGFMLDIKAYYEEEHLILIGKKNDIVLANLEYLASLGKLEEIRTVLVEGYSNFDLVDNITKTLAPYLSKRNIRYKLISYRPFGVRSEYLKLKSISNREKENLAEVARQNGFSDIVLI